MKIGILIDEVRFGGVEKVAIEEVRALTDLGHHAVLVILRRTGSKAYNEALMNVKRIYFSDLLPKPLRLSFKFPFFRFLSLFHLTYALLIRFVPIRTRFDVIVSHGTFTCFSGVALAKSKSIPMIAFVWDPIVHILRTVYFSSNAHWNSLVRPIALTIGVNLDKWICRNACKILTASRSHEEWLKHLSNDSRRVRILFPGVHVRRDVERRKQSYAIMVTAWKEGKEPEYALELASRTERLRFVLAGAWITESLKTLFLNQVAEFGAKDRITVVGALEEAKLLDLYSQALVFLQTRSDVGFGLPALEAAGQGCTFIIPKGQGVCNLFTHGREGFIVAEKDTERIVRFLQQLLESPEMASSMGDNARKRAQEFSWVEHARNLYNLALD